jgi:asparagine synthase (glutamine-hydrolysing)
LIRGIAKLRPGHWLEWRDGRIETECYWVHRVWPEARHTLDSAREQLDELLTLAVKEHLLSDVPLGIWASGGLDSTTILHYATAHAGRKVKTFSVSFAGRSFDESRYFREVAQAYGAEHHEFDLNPEAGLPDTVEQMAWYSDEPSADAGALPVWYLSKMCREHVTVALSGDGADELFAGYNTYVADAYARQARQIPAAARQAALLGLRLWPASNDKISFEYKLKRFLEGSLLDAQAAHLAWNGTHTDAERKALYRADGDRSVRDLYRMLPGEYAQSGELNRYLWLDQRFYLADDILYKCDRMSMAHSLEVRPPFLDHRVVDFTNSLPEDLKIRNGELKFLLRHLMRDRLPQSVLTRKKEGFDIPAHHWMRTVLRPLLLDTLSEQSVARTGLFDWPTMKQRIDGHMARRSNSGYHLWGLLTLFLWMKRWNVQPGAEHSPSLSLPPRSTLLESSPRRP